MSNREFSLATEAFLNAVGNATVGDIEDRIKHLNYVANDLRNNAIERKYAKLLVKTLKAVLK